MSLPPHVPFFFKEKLIYLFNLFGYIGSYLWYLRPLLHHGGSFIATGSLSSCGAWVHLRRATLVASLYTKISGDAYVGLTPQGLQVHT